MIQDTSIAAFRTIQPQLGNRQREVLNGFSQYGAKTNLEMSVLLGRPINQITPRTNELVKMGYLQKLYTIQCTVSHMKAIAWVRIK